MTIERRPTAAWLYDDLLAWLSPGGLLLTALALRFPRGLQLLRAEAPELTLPTWLAGAYVVGLALSPLGRLVYGAAQGIVWPRLRASWTPAISFLADRLERSEGLSLPAAASMSTHVFHDVDRRMREYPGGRRSVFAAGPQSDESAVQPVVQRGGGVFRICCGGRPGRQRGNVDGVTSRRRRTGHEPGHGGGRVPRAPASADGAVHLAPASGSSGKHERHSRRTMRCR